MTTTQQARVDAAATSVMALMVAYGSELSEMPEDQALLHADSNMLKQLIGNATQFERLIKSGISTTRALQLLLQTNRKLFYSYCSAFGRQPEQTYGVRMH